MRSLALAVVLLAAISSVNVPKAVAATTTSWIQPGYVFYYEVYVIKGQNPQKVGFMQWSIVSVEGDVVTLELKSDVLKNFNGQVKVSRNGEIKPGVLLGFWLPEGFTEGELNIAGYRAVAKVTQQQVQGKTVEFILAQAVEEPRVYMWL
ncbi:MAG: hypothetical protein DRJ43_04170, partial [Thermoprotei archaeon]